ncbi:MAG: diguanylate cyclase [Microbacteriaceae bacterium]|jgi:HD superfamily phosphodiesterase|nr:diguanylate cyclase [Microbacteriaceae bacterium]
MIETIAGITIPDTALVADATSLVRETTDDLLFHHSRRVFLFGALQGKRLGLQPDLELLYVGAMFHDLGLTGHYGSDHLRFEVDGANAAREFLLDHGISADDAYNVWTAVALHTTPAIPEFMTPEVALVTAGVETDVLGIQYEALALSDVAAVVSAHPRPDFKRRILAAFTEGNIRRPETTFGNVNADVLARFHPGFQRTDFVDIIENSAWAE